jgi:hypothetical protein
VYITVHYNMLFSGWWLHIQSIASGIVFTVGSIPVCGASCVKVWCELIKLIKPSGPTENTIPETTDYICSHQTHNIKVPYHKHILRIVHNLTFHAILMLLIIHIIVTTTCTTVCIILICNFSIHKNSLRMMYQHWIM